MKKLQLNIFSSINTRLLVLMLMLHITYAKAQTNMSGRYRLNLDLKQAKAHPKKIYLWYDAFSKGEKVTYMDSAIVNNGKVEFTGTINEPHEAQLSINPPLSKQMANEGDRLNFYLTTGMINIIVGDSLNRYTQKGGYFLKDYQAFSKVKRYYDHKVIALAMKTMQLDRHKDSTQYQQASKEFDKMVDFYANSVCKNWVMQHPATPVSLLPLRWFAGSVIHDPFGVDSVYNHLTKSVKSLPSAIDIKRRIDNVKRSAIGNEAPLFMMADTAGKPVSLEAYRGSYVLLDFWASWCAPCRRENPNIIANFNKYHSRNFMVISVSLDNQGTKSAWLKAIINDKLEKWPHLSDLKGFNSAAALLYGVQAVPQNFLIDPSGKIIGKNLFGSELTQKLEQVLKSR
ncbi:TlpA disulfide reductase family protein [Pedobacter sp. MR22-3]|uniref:TlpA disulfide reductase family protein n=1 Tax=Pedobacter sp. MR22-3 TaxID=2994552 RepID=UPI0022450958|nr:TlpA disulfide reductase family protein [Pedobacter sp. MR22-3]MCX2584437.1 TlpA disulfide reductase family protein [Pedobacter sp. MR22-3]